MSDLIGYENRTVFSPRGILRKGSLALRVVGEMIAHYMTLVDEDDDMEKSEFDTLDRILSEFEKEMKAADSLFREWSEHFIVGSTEDHTPQEFTSTEFLALYKDDDNPGLMKFSPFAQWVLSQFPLKDDKYAHNARFKAVHENKHVGHCDERGRVWLFEDCE